MKDHRFQTMENIVPLVSPVDTVATAVASAFVDLKFALNCTFFAFFGSITSASADQGVVVTIEAATAAASGSEVAVSYRYRLSSAVADNTWGAITAATSSGVTVGTGDDNKILAVNIDPATLEGQLADARFVRIVITPDAGASATEIAAWAVLDPRYPQLTHKSAT